MICTEFVPDNKKNSKIDLLLWATIDPIPAHLCRAQPVSQFPACRDVTPWPGRSDGGSSVLALLPLWMLGPEGGASIWLVSRTSDGSKESHTEKMNTSEQGGIHHAFTHEPNLLKNHIRAPPPGPNFQRRTRAKKEEGEVWEPHHHCHLAYILSQICLLRLSGMAPCGSRD